MPSPSQAGRHRQQSDGRLPAGKSLDWPHLDGSATPTAAPSLGGRRRLKRLRVEEGSQSDLELQLDPDLGEDLRLQTNLDVDACQLAGSAPGLAAEPQQQHSCCMDWQESAMQPGPAEQLQGAGQHPGPFPALSSPDPSLAALHSFQYHCGSVTPASERPEQPGRPSSIPCSLPTDRLSSQRRSSDRHGQGSESCHSEAPDADPFAQHQPAQAAPPCLGQRCCPAQGAKAAKHCHLPLAGVSICAVLCCAARPQ